MNQVTGFVVEKNNIGVGKGSNIVLSDGKKYGLYDPAPFNELSVGDEVQFEFTQKGQYTNIKGGITKTGKTNPNAAAEAPAPKASAGGWNKGQFPIGNRDHARSIVRQNSITNAVNFASHFVKGATPDDIVDIAKVFEAYSCGDIEAEAAESAIKQMKQTAEASVSTDDIPF